MEHNRLTENELVLELEKAGFEHVSKRSVGNWRREALLPDFDIRGRGRGKGQGKTESVWEHPSPVIEQAKWIQRMRGVGIPYENLYLNLWMLDFPIHPENVRDSLLEPLEDRIEMLEQEANELRRKWRLGARNDGIIEDVINDGAAAAISKIEKTPFEPLAIPQDIVETVANIFLNPSFRVDLSDLNALFSELEGWDEITNKFGDELFKELGKEGVDKDRKHIQVIALLLQNGDFVQRHFSLHQVEKAVRECTDEDLAKVQADLRILTRIVMIFGKMMDAVSLHVKLPDDSTFSTDALLPSLFGFAEYFVLADISLRRNGYSQLIDQSRAKALRIIEEEFSEKVRKDLEQAAPLLGEAFNQAFEIVERKFTELAEKSPEFQMMKKN